MNNVYPDRESKSLEFKSQIPSFHNLIKECASFAAKFDFIKSVPGPFYSLRVKKYGTKGDPALAYKAVPINEEIFYRFQGGKYIEISQNGHVKKRPKLEMSR